MSQSPLYHWYPCAVGRGFGSLLINGQVVPTLTLAPCQHVIIADKSEGQMPLCLEVTSQSELARYLSLKPTLAIIL